MVPAISPSPSFFQVSHMSSGLPRGAVLAALPSLFDGQGRLVGPGKASVPRIRVPGRVCDHSPSSPRLLDPVCLEGAHHSPKPWGAAGHGTHAAHFSAALKGSLKRQGSSLNPQGSRKAEQMDPSCCIPGWMLQARSLGGLCRGWEGCRKGMGGTTPAVSSPSSSWHLQRSPPA